MTHRTASVFATLLVSFPAAAVAAQLDCEAVPKGPARTDCYLALSQFYRAQSDLAAASARVQSDAAWYRAITGTDPPKRRSRHRQQRLEADYRWRWWRSMQHSFSLPAGGCWFGPQHIEG